VGARNLLGVVSEGAAEAPPIKKMIVLDGEEFLTVEEAARLLGIKRTTLYAYVSRGRLSSYRQGIKRERLYRRAEVEQLLRVAPSGGREEARRSSSRRRAPRDIPLAESWIRD
jgi:excisionase family DNA binding protein